MTLKSLILAGLLISLAGCSNQSQGITIDKFYPVLPVCDGITARDDFISANGYLDVAAGAPQFFIGINLIGGANVTQKEVVVGGTQIERPNRDQPVLNQMVINYRLSKRLGGTPKPFITNVVLPFNKDGEVFGTFQLISADLATLLFDGLTPSSTIDDFVDVAVDVEFKGEMSASRAPFSTGVLTYPIRAFRSNPAACANGYLRFGTDMMSGAVDSCGYVGQRSSQLLVPTPPTCCPSMGAPGC